MTTQTNNASKELVATIKTPVVITGNFDEVRAHFIEELKKYDLVVTAETLPDAKKLATQLNKAATEVKGRGRTISTEASAPIDAFNNQVKELAQLLLDARTKLTEQVKRFEDETRAAALVTLQAYLVEQGEDKGIQPEFQRATVDDLANLSTLTSTGKLSAKAKSAVDERINADLQLQTQTEMRLLRLENESLKAGLAAPLTRTHVEAFLFADDAVYQQRLAALFETELQREQHAQQAMRRKLEQEQQRQVEAEERARQAEEAAVESQRLAAERQAKHESDMAKLKAQQQEQPAPQSQFDSQQAPAIKHAIGPRYKSSQAKVSICTFEEAAKEAALFAVNENCDEVGIWTKQGGLVAVLLTGSAVSRQESKAA